MRPSLRILAVCLLGCPALSLAGADLPPINPAAGQTYFSGKFVWCDLITSDPAGAAKFYTGLLGWDAATIERTTSSEPRPYTVLSVRGRAIAGIVTRAPRSADQAHGHWIGFVSVPDVKKALAAATAAGGHARGPARTVPQRGVQAILADPEGAELGVVHSSTGDPGEYLPDPGDWAWAQLFAHDASTEAAFYRAACGYETVAVPRSGRPDDQILVSGGFSRASVSPTAGSSHTPAAWLLFVRVKNVRATATLAEKLGGQVVVAPSVRPTEYWRAVIADPSGALIGVVELDDAGVADQQP
jgi:predicted enzyme related to lactoylglutathione lyase